ncbi:hypothetical protein IWW39_002506 [Coemansia spiralis]|uniref:Uncharacterized protein n=1 Tax=Coemansia spiralis TaxID=417178 RepID=A0A9W8GK20_9FUNG|nr:hypothetical protein IWW39_002506 [Coemansia spiralis]
MAMHNKVASIQQLVLSDVCADTAVPAPAATANDVAAYSLHPASQDTSSTNGIFTSTQQQAQSDRGMSAALSLCH